MRPRCHVCWSACSRSRDERVRRAQRRQGNPQRQGLTSITLAASPTASPIPGRAEGRAGAVAVEHQRAAGLDARARRQCRRRGDRHRLCGLHLNASSCGIGGGGFMLVHQTDGSVSAPTIARRRRRSPIATCIGATARSRPSLRHGGLPSRSRARLPASRRHASASRASRATCSWFPRLRSRATAFRSTAAKEINQDPTAPATPRSPPSSPRPCGQPATRGRRHPHAGARDDARAHRPRRCEPVLPRDHRRRDRSAAGGILSNSDLANYHALALRARGVPRLRGVHDAAADLAA